MGFVHCQLLLQGALDQQFQGYCIMCIPKDAFDAEELPTFATWLSA